jgi:hypothetical protein
VVGAILGGFVAYIGATWVFVCRGGPGVGIVSCPEPNILLALLWGVPIGFVVGLLIGFVISRRLASNRDTSVRSAAPPM